MNLDQYTANVAVIGGGLGGLMAAIRLSELGSRVALIDDPLPDSAGLLGGFARFSGAKFSFPPAGMGLLSVAGSAPRFNRVIDRVVSQLGLADHRRTESIEQTTEIGAGLSFRRYHSVVLAPHEVEAILARLTDEVRSKVVVVSGKVDRLEYAEGLWLLHGQWGNTDIRVSAETVFYAAGRLSDGLLLRAGAVPSEGKGMDIGIRLEFTDKTSVAGLASLGPDAKLMCGQLRTFCLNSPGAIYRYPFKNISIPGGIVADSSAKQANVGILLRVSNKQERLKNILEVAGACHLDLMTESSRFSSGSNIFKVTSVLERLYGVDEVTQLGHFVNKIAKLGLIDTHQAHRVHMPLLDWHWHTFSRPNSHKTSLPFVYALGDSSGHARGLLQAAVSGWLAAEEFHGHHG